jgi:cytochrome oxidase Cu insertion factor (SCO1/SenC/PrrC family)/copper(I)-binding protein
MPIPRAAHTLLTLLAVIACEGAPLPRGGGVELQEAIPKHDFTLTATDGQRFRFREQTAGRVTFLFFGYTHCPDVCPVQMAGLASALRELDPEDQRRVAVVFVTTDPGRDTPARLRTWLDAFSRDFIGLTGSQTEIDSVQRLYDLAPAVREAPRADSSYLVGHAAQLIAFGVDDTARTVYPFGQRQSEWGPELRRLLNLVVPPAAPVPLAPDVEAFPDGFAIASVDGRTAAAYPVLRSTTALVDTLVLVTTPAADSVLVHRTDRRSGRYDMVRAERLLLAPGSILRMAPGEGHMMLEGLRRPLRPGDTIKLTVQLRVAGSRTLTLPVRSYEDVARQ